MKHETSLTLFDYWNDARRGRFAPHRFDIEPSRIGEILPDTMIVERLTPSDYRFRLAGTRICDDFGTEFRGTSFLDVFGPEDTHVICANLDVMARQGAVGLFHLRSTNAQGQSAASEMIILPLLHAPQSVDRYLGAWSLDPTDEAIARRENSGPYIRHTVVDYELIWPRGRPTPLHKDVTQSDTPQPPPLKSSVRHARIVHVDRRHFRIYDGGLAGQPLDKP